MTVICFFLHSESLNLGSNNFWGPIYSEIGQLTKLKNLFMEDNQLTGTLPFDAMTKLINIETIHLFGNFDLSGALLEIATVGPWSQLLDVSAWDTGINGQIPSDISKLNKIQSIRLGDVAISGSFPEGLFHLSNLKTFSIGSQHFDNASLLPSIANLISMGKSTQFCLQ